MKSIYHFKAISGVIFLFLIEGIFLQAQPGAPNSWSIVASYSIPGKASGLTWDGNYIYFGIYGSNGNEVYRFNPSSGTSSLQCTGPFDDSYGMTFKNPNLVIIKQPSSSAQPSQALEFTLGGAQVSALNLPDHYMSGIAWDNGSYWVCTYYPDPGTVYHINGSGTVLSQFTPPGSQPWDICIQGSDLWIADYWANMLYKVTSAGVLLESHASQSANPAGVVFDGTYLWYCDGPTGGTTSTLYKIDLLGSGTPVINIPMANHDYGNVTTGSSLTWNCQVQNTGTANLIITGLDIPSGQPVSTTLTMPVTVTPGSQVNIPLTYAPLAAGPLNTVVQILSNDPIHQQVPVTLTGNAVIAGPHINLVMTSHDYGERRAGAYSRWILSVTNDGNQPLIITSLDMTDEHFITDQSIVLPLTIETLQTTNLGLWFHPTEGISYSGTLNIISNDPTQSPFPVQLSGLGVDTLYAMGTPLWSYLINTSYDNSPKAIKSIQDITGDGIDDVVVASEDNYLRCFNGNASVTADVLWETSIYSGTVQGQNGLATIPDINNDGYQDLIVGLAWGDRSITAFSGKTGLIIWKHDTHEYGQGGWVYQVDVSHDYNGDGFPDVLAATGDDGNGTGPDRVYCLNGKTGISIWEHYNGGAVFSVIGVEDFTGDGIPDVVAGATNANETAGRVIGINGAGGATMWTYNTPGSSVWALMQVDDVNSDGIKDVAVGDYSGNVMILNSVTGIKINQLNIGNVLILRFERMEDVNKDGHPDILVGHSGTNGIIINGFNCSLIWSKPMVDKAWNVANIGDVNWDGINDAIIGTLYQTNKVYFMDGVFGTELFSGNTNTPVDAINSIPDIVGDNTREMVFGGRNGLVVCLSGGYDPNVGIQPPDEKLQSSGVRVFPDPFHDQFTVVYELVQPVPVTVTLRDVLGNSLGSVSESMVTAGKHEIPFVSARLNSGSLKQGIYIIEIVMGDKKQHVKVIHLK